MATANVELDIQIESGQHLYIGTITMDSSYPTGGEAIDVSGNERFKKLIPQSKAGYIFSWDAANQKLLAYYADYDAVADGALIQVPNTTDLSAVTGIDFIAIGS